MHRDLKPENILIHKDPGTDEVEKIKVIDFGFATKLRNTLCPPLSNGTYSSGIDGKTRVCPRNVLDQLHM